MNQTNNYNLAIVHDYLTQFGGAEQVLKSFYHLYPEAPIYTLLYDKKAMGEMFNQVQIRVSYLRKFPRFFQKNKKWLLPFLPTAPETFDLRDYNLILSSSSAFAKGIITKPKAIHICYCHSPMRFVWDWHHNYLKEQKLKGLKKLLAVLFLHYIRMWDQSSAERVDYFIANSKTTQGRIKKYYGRDSQVIYPPVDIEKFIPIKENKGYFLIVSRLSPYKRIDLAVEAFNKLELPLVIIGQGPQKRQLQKLANKNIKFLGFQPEEKVKEYYQNCQALIFPGEEDFGITAIEAMAAGKPVLAFRSGGLTETVIEGVTGEFFDDPISEVLADGVRRLRENQNKYEPLIIRGQAEKFSRQRFEKEIKEFIESKTIDK